MNKVKIILIACALLGAVANTGCYRFTVPVAKLMSPKLDVEYKALEEQIENLESQYETSVENYQNNIEKEKEATDQNIKKGDLEASLASVVRLYALTHPCGEEDCGTYPCRGQECRESYRNVNKMPPINRYEAYMDRERIGNERDFILEAVERIYNLTQKQIEEGRFSELDMILVGYVEKIPGPTENKQRFDKIHKNVKQLWIDTLVAQAEEVEGDHPGAAMLYYAKASGLATEKGDAPQSQELMGQAKEAKERILSDYHYTVTLGSVSGPHSDKLAQIIKGSSYSGAMSMSASGRGNATLSISTGNPSHSRSTGSTTGSFQYKSGERQVENPAWRSAQANCKDAQEDYREEAEECAAQPTNSAGQSTRQCDGVPSYQSKAESACSEVDNYPQTITEDVFDSESYPIDLYHLDTTLPVKSRITHTDGRPDLQGGMGSARLTDEAHDSHERNGSGVSADGVSLPSESSGVSAAIRDAGTKHASIVQRSFEDYRTALLGEDRGGEVAEIHNIATYIILEPGNVSESAAKRLNEITGIANASSTVRRVP